jgi:hypothetical protein
MNELFKELAKVRESDENLSGFLDYFRPLRLAQGPDYEHY